MDIHKPKAAHSIREFLIEIGTIICGILIALSLELLADQVHQNGIAKETRENVREELARVTTEAHTRRFDQGCINARLSQLQTLINGVVSGSPAPKINWIGRPKRLSLNMPRWDAAAHSGHISLLTSDEQSSYGFLYDILAKISLLQDQEQMAWSRLRVLEGKTKVWREQWVDADEALHQAMWLNFSINQITDKVAETAARLSLPPALSVTGASQSTCIPITTGRTDAERAGAIPGYRAP
jgi:hypothetical protein